MLHTHNTSVKFYIFTCRQSSQTLLGNAYMACRGDTEVVFFKKYKNASLANCSVDWYVEHERQCDKLLLVALLLLLLLAAVVAVLAPTV